MRPWVPYAVVVGSLACLTLSPVIVRYAQAENVPSITIAGGRLLLAAILITPFVWRRYRPELAVLSRQDVTLLAVAGVWMALNGMLVIASLEFIPVLANQMLASTAPIWAALLETIWFKTRFHGLIWVGVGLVLVGSLIIGGPLGAERSLSWTGVWLALASAICAAVYALLGRRARTSVSLIPYMWVVYGAGGLFSVGCVALARVDLWGYSAAGFGWIAASTIFVQLLGFSGMAFALAHFPATLIVLMTRSVAVTSAVLAFFLFREVPTGWQVTGSVILFLGILSAVLGQEIGKQRSSFRAKAS